MSYTIINSNNIDYLKTQPDNCFDSIVTDPPYGIEFLAKDWDSNTGALETWQECLRTLKPGGYILAFSAARTYHQLATNIEQAGFEIRDQIMWIYASGFPKAQDIGKAIDKRGIDNQLHGWKTALKPAHEPIVMARKPFKGSTIDNVLKHGVGALNIDASRITTDELKPAKIGRDPRNNLKSNGVESDIPYTEAEWIPNEQGRYPANVLGDIPDYQKYFYCPKVSRKERHCGFEQDPINHFEMVEQMGGYYVDENGDKDQARGTGGNMIWLPHKGKIYTHGLKHEYEEWCKKNKKDSLAHIATGNNIGDGVYAPGTAGPSNKDPLAHIPTSKGGMLGTDGEWAPEHWHGEKGQKLQGEYTQTGTLGRMKDAYEQSTKSVGNNHPTVKPVALMRYLIQLVTPKGGRVLDPFSGSGSTGMAAVELGHEFVGCDLDPNYVEIAKKRIEGWNQKTPQQEQFEKVFDDSN